MKTRPGAFLLSSRRSPATPIPPNVEAAEFHFRHAGALASELGMRPLVAHCHLGLGKLYRWTGERGQAHEHLTAAAAIYREMDMGFWLGRAEAELECGT